MHSQNQISPQSATFSQRRPSVSMAGASPPYVPWPHPQQQHLLSSFHSDFSSANTPSERSPPALPDFVRPFSENIGADEALFLHKKGALSIPERHLRVALLEGYVDFVYPYMPTLDLNEFLSIVQHEDGALGRVSLLVFQAVMFAGSAYVDMAHLRRAGYANRQEARKALYQKARLLYDFDYEDDRIYLLQALLIMTTWYESPNDQKDTWHWMGIAISVATSIGLNRDPSRGQLEKGRQRLWKRLWWSTVMRDRLIAIGMRRPLRIKSQEHNVPMLALDDFPLSPLGDDVTVVGGHCVVARSAEMRTKLARLCIAKAEFCDCINRVLSTQYAPPSTNPASRNTEQTTEFLLPNRREQIGGESKACENELRRWFERLPEEAQLPVDADTLPAIRQPANPSEAPLILSRALLHQVYYMTLSAFYRPLTNPTDHSITPYEQLFASGPTNSRDQVRYAAFRITQLAHNLLRQSLARYLPTTGVTVLQPAIISHMMDIKSPHLDVRTQGLRGFCQSIEVLNRLRDMYAGAEYSMMIIDAAVRRANIDTNAWPIFTPDQDVTLAPQDAETTAPPQTQIKREAQHDDTALPRRLVSIEGLVDAGLRQQIVAPLALQGPPTPPPEGVNGSAIGHEEVSGGRQAATTILNDEAVASRLAMYLATTTPPASSGDDGTGDGPFSDTFSPNFFKVEGTNPWMRRQSNITLSRTPKMAGAMTPTNMDFDREFENLINTEDLADPFASGECGFVGMQGESSGFLLDLGILGIGAEGEGDEVGGEGVGDRVEAGVGVGAGLDGLGRMSYAYD